MCSIEIEDHPLSLQIGDPLLLHKFLHRLFGCLSEIGMSDVVEMQIDHICWRCASEEEYLRFGKIAASLGELLVEGMIGGRAIATFKLHEPLTVTIDGKRKEIPCLEVPAPKAGTQYQSGWEHVECVVGDGGSSPIDPTPVLLFRDRHPKLPFITEALEKDCNADVSLSFPCGDYIQDVVVKFHACSLSEVIAYEKEQSAAGNEEHGVVPVPADRHSILRELCLS